MRSAQTQCQSNERNDEIMATYTKKLKTLAVHLMLDSEVVTIADTASDDMATRALNEFKKYETMHYETEDGGQKVTNAIPYHAVQYIEVTETDGSIEREDPYGCEGGVSDTYTMTFVACSGVETPPSPIEVPVGESFTLPIFEALYPNKKYIESCENQNVAYPLGAEITPTEDMTFYCFSINLT